MEFINYTLIADGSSDKALMSIIKWILDDLYPKIPNKGSFADFRMLQNPPKKNDVKNQVRYAQHYYPFDILFYHRDAESINNEIINLRIGEIKEQLEDVFHSKIICIVPIIMMESWLLLDETAIKKAAGNKNYKDKIDLPSVKTIETIKDPKLLLHNLLTKVSGLKSRQLKNFNVNKAVHLVAENILDFSSLRKLKAFNKFELDLKSTINELIQDINQFT
jgi:hypothetical protein